MSIRIEKVQSEIKKILAQPINEIALENFRGKLITVTSVVVSKDLSVAKVYLSVFGGKEPPLEVITFIEDKASQLRGYLGRNIRLRITPELKFFLDDTLDQIEHFQDLIKKANSNNADS